MNPLTRQFADLKFALQELESAVQQPREEKSGTERILYYFPAVMSSMMQVLSEALICAECETHSIEEVFIAAHTRGWLRGDLGLWTHLAREFEHFEEIDHSSHRAISLVQHIRACSSMLWQTYEILMQRFRSQTQVTAMPVRTKAAQPVVHFLSRAV